MYYLALSGVELQLGLGAVGLKKELNPEVLADCNLSVSPKCFL